MTLEMWIIAVVRIGGSLPVLRWPFYGGILALLIDQSDLLMMNLLDLGGVTDYQTFDKYLDQVYLALFLIVALRWEGPLRWISIGLYTYRFVGFVAFELTENRTVLLLFPNFFEVWFLFIAAVKQFNLRERLSTPVLGLIAGVLVAVKLFQEYAIHHQRWLDDFTTIEALEAIWRTLTP